MRAFQRNVAVAAAALVAGLSGAGTRATGAAPVPICRCRRHPQHKINCQIKIVPADGTRAAKRKRRLRYVAVFGQWRGQKLIGGGGGFRLRRPDSLSN
ncbi:MAG: hypothetical protein QOF56_541 [Acidobacteriaceae bacterium]|jgi:hypothetical protein|nr:hypothetical protein [Acidobacteriaceae bacterium]